jgi:hypothetical protein
MRRIYLYLCYEIIEWFHWVYICHFSEKKKCKFRQNQLWMRRSARLTSQTMIDQKKDTGTKWSNARIGPNEEVPFCKKINPFIQKVWAQRIMFANSSECNCEWGDQHGSDNDRSKKGHGTKVIKFFILSTPKCLLVKYQTQKVDGALKRKIGKKKKGYNSWHQHLFYFFS